MKLLSIFVLVIISLFSQKILAKQSCRIVFDAGSSGTRLYIYEKTSDGKGWIEHEGPKVEALADPIREIRGKKWADMEAVAQTIPKALDLIKSPGQGWKPFDWEKHCNIISARVLATAGMRIAEQLLPDKSLTLWNRVKMLLSQKLGNNVKIKGRALSGFEEGFYAWLSVYQGRKSQPNFGIVEMGGASAQIAFPCNNCAGARKVFLDGDRNFKIFSYSFLGLGGDVASEIFGGSKLCSSDAFKTTPRWNEKLCADSILLKTTSGINDPLNFNKGKKGTSVIIPRENTRGLDWYLTGALSLLGSQISVEKCCMAKGECFEPRTACFRSVYFKKFLDELGISMSSKKASTSWTLGATICEENNCLREVGPLQCNWSTRGCINSF